MDAYCKLEHWGIQVYAAIDVYSRFIIWIYAGISARSAMSVFKQYLITIRDSHVMPRLIRTDRGGETVLAADAHYYVSSDVRRDEAPLRFGDCFRYGTSKQNQRIEAWWNQLRRARISRWRERFFELSENGEYIRGSTADRIAFLAIYLPLIRHEMLEFVNTWNFHYIRRQKGRDYLQNGMPFMLYRYPEDYGAQRCGYYVEPEIAERMEGLTAGFGEIFLHICSSRHSR